jgi:hypothetical protein
MLSSIFETFVSELQKEETQQQIKEFIDPYINKYVNFYFYVVIGLLFLITMSTMYNSYMIHTRFSNL